MASVVSLLLLSRSSKSIVLLSRKPWSFPKAYYINRRLLSTIQSPLLQSESVSSKTLNVKKSLSEKMSFVFEQIDAMEKEKTVKDEALQRIRSWREKKKQDSDESKESKIENREDQNNHMEHLIESNVSKKGVELFHPWPEWIELIERLVQQNYFDHKRIAEPMLIEELPVEEDSTVKDEGYEFTKDWIAVRNAMVNFGRDRFDILRSLSRKDIQVLVGHGCPVVDPKVVYSGKLLRKYVQLNEGDVCSSCSLRNACTRAYLLASKEDEARTIDIMRLLLAFGFDPINGSCENKSVLRMKSVRTVLRKLMHEIVKLSAVPIDPTLPPPVIKKRLPKVKQPPPPPKKRIGRDDIEMKKGDWLCPKCDFMNFAKNTVCLQCDAKRPKRQLLPGEWECPECNFLNYRRNMTCFHCDHKRPPDEFIDHDQEKLRGARIKLDRDSNVPGISKAWNFDFDDDESDGADVASFEYADPRTNEDCFQSQPDGEFKPDILESRERNPFKRPEITHGNGFDDFDDDDDDVDSYELDLSNNNLQKKSTCLDSDEEVDYDFNKKTSVPVQKRVSLVGSDDDNNDDGFDSDDVGVHPKWRSSHIANTRQKKSWHRSQQYGREASDSHDELELNIDSDVSDCNFNSRSNVRNKGKLRSYESEDNSTWESDDDFSSLRNRPKGNKVGFSKKDNSSRDSDRSRNPRWRSNDTNHELLNTSRGNKFDNSYRNSRSISKNRNFDRSSSSSNTKFDRSFTIRYGNDREHKGNVSGNRRSNDRHHFNDFDDSEKNDFRDRRHIMSNNFNSRSDRPRRNFDDSEKNDFRDRRHIMSNNFNSRSDRSRRNFDDDRVRRRIIER